VRNITVSLDDDVCRRARIAAAAMDTSVSALVKIYLQQLAAVETETERLKRQEREIRNWFVEFTASARLSRQDTHNRSL
jgi:Family of unknown function (DUF6364)